MLRGSVSHGKTKGMTLQLSITFELKKITFTCLQQTKTIDSVCDKLAYVDMPFRILWKAIANHSSENYTGFIKEGKLKVGSYEAIDTQIRFFQKGSNQLEN